MAVNLLMMPTLVGHALASHSPHQEILGLGWNDQLLHVTVFNPRHHLMEVA